MEILLNLNSEEFEKKFRELSWEEQKEVSGEIRNLIKKSENLQKKVLRWLIATVIGLAACWYGHYNAIPGAIPAAIAGATLLLCFTTWEIILVREYFVLNDKKNYIEFFRFGKKNGINSI